MQQIELPYHEAGILTRRDFAFKGQPPMLIVEAALILRRPGKMQHVPMGYEPQTQAAWAIASEPDYSSYWATRITTRSTRSGTLSSEDGPDPLIVWYQLQQPDLLVNPVVYVDRMASPPTTRQVSEKLVMYLTKIKMISVKVTGKTPRC